MYVKIGKEDDSDSKGGVEDVGADYDEDVGHLEGDGVEDNDEKNGDENVGAEEESKERNGSDAVADEKVFKLRPSIPTQVSLSLSLSLSLSFPLSLLPDSDGIEWDSYSKPPS